MGRTFSYQGHHFYLDDEKVFLNSGEIHYFRIKRDLWDNHLTAAKEAGLTTVSTYVPWAWHEPEEGLFDFDGTTIPERDLKGWLQRCRAHGLLCILKPGPFILAETRGAGLPFWFLDRNGNEVKMHNRQGEIVQSDGVSLFHPLYLEKVTRWYDQIMPLIRDHELGVDGPVIMMQVCNEIGVFSWLAHQADYNEEVRSRFIRYLENKYKRISAINELWETGHTAFSDIELPPDGHEPFSSKGDRSRDYEWHLFWRTYYGDYLRMLANMARERGVTVPFYHNLPGWIYGSGYEFPVNITMYDDLFGDKSEMIFGVDHIPEFLSHRNMHDDRIINDITIAMQGKKPLFAAEFQCGSREHHVVTNPTEMELFYKASLSNGLTGWNYYMFSQGKNPRHRGYSGQSFYWFTPVTPDGERGSAFPLVQRMSRLVNVCETILLNASRRAEICVLFYPPYYSTELERPEAGASELQFNYTAIRRPAWFDGLLKALQVLNIDYDMMDLTKTSAGLLNSYKQVWAFSTDEMNARDQQVLVDYSNAGGRLVIFPGLPDREMSQNPCSILREALNITPSGSEVIDSPLIDVFNLQDIKCANPQLIYQEESLDGSEIIARTIQGKPCGFEKRLGKGSVLHLGTWIGFDTEGHIPVYQAILDRSKASLRKASSTNYNISVRERFTDDGSALLFIGNYFNEEQQGQIRYTHPVSGKTMSLPFSGDSLFIPALTGILTPVCKPLTEKLFLLHSTSDILNVNVIPEGFEITLYGDRDLPGELVLEGEDTQGIVLAVLDGDPAEKILAGNHLIITYRHKHRHQMILSLQMTSK